MRNIHRGSLLLLALSLPLLAHCRPTQSPVRPPSEPEGIMPKPREISDRERSEIVDLIAKRFRRTAPEETQFRAAGPFRFVQTKEFLYTDRTDVGSVGFEMSTYGVSDAVLDERSIAREVLVPRIEAAVLQTGLDASGRRFAAFNDEFVGAARPAQLPPRFDPREVSRRVARTVAFERTIDAVSVFDSELIVGLMPDGQIGRFRLHWPTIDGRAIKKARALEEAVRSGRWSLPQTLKSPDVEVLEVRAGVAHSAFADPGFRADGVVRVLFRRTARDTRQPISSTGYKYFDESGQEVVLHKFPEAPRTPAEQKPPGKNR